ncbi:SDR family oxidoreductase [Thermocatellispora tengchongensis]|uniref:SDR family oxidoreductase n=1 Tax=Thermocatellispora tengchongensis TaxID=1073253 RepID=UPI00362624C7
MTKSVRVFLAGATGVVGRRVVPLLVKEGHEVVALTSRPEAVAGLRAAGAEAVVADVYDAAALRGAVRDAAPDVVMHQLTDLRRRDLAANARIRTEGTRNLVAAALEAGVRRIVAQSIAWAYGPGRGPPPRPSRLTWTRRRPATRPCEAWRRWRRLCGSCRSGWCSATGCCTARTPGTTPAG